MKRRNAKRWTGSVVWVGAAMVPGVLLAETVAVRYPEGSAHAFLQVSAADGKVIAGGDLVEETRGDQVTARLLFRFRDGSVDDERVVYSQQGRFRLETDRHIQRGPSFLHPVDVALNMATGVVTTRTGEEGHEMVETEHMELPTDLANGMLLLMLKNLSPRTAVTTVSYLASTPKPRLVHLRISASGEAGFAVGGVHYGATRFVVKPELGGLEGAMASVFGMQPKQTEVWMSSGGVPAFARLEGPTFLGGPEWTVEMAKPSWPAAIRKTAVDPADGKVVR